MVVFIELCRRVEIAYDERVFRGARTDKRVAAGTVHLEEDVAGFEVSVC